MNNDRDEINIGELVRYIFTHLPLVILTTIAGGLCFYILAAYIVTPQYVSDIKIGVYTQPGQQVNPLSNIQADSYLVQDYAVVIKSRKVAETVIDELNLLQNEKPMSPDTLIEKVVVDPGDGTSRMITVSIVYDDPFLAADIAAKYAEVSLEIIKESYPIDNIRIVDNANVPLKQYSPNTFLFIVLGLALGMTAGTAVLIILFLIVRKIGMSY